MGSFRTASARLERISAKDRKTLARLKKRFDPDVERGLLKKAEKLDALRPPAPRRGAIFFQRISAKQSYNGKRPNA
jgi:hypothetical protein